MPRTTTDGDTSAAAEPAMPTRDFATPVGTVTALVDGDVIRARGIPYAVAERFSPPRPVPPRLDEAGQPVPIRAVRRAPASPQLPSAAMDTLFPGANEGVEVADETSLTLTVTIPADIAEGESLPVMVWIHGGSYVTGAADVDIYDPRALVAEQRVIVVGIGYRLSVLGYGGSGAEGGIPANLGLLDQLAAVRWVHENIAGFGGSPERITLFGQSAGGDAVADLMISDGAAGLFQRAIVQSAPLGIRRRRRRLERAIDRILGTPSSDMPLDELLALQTRIERAGLRFGLPGGMPFAPRYGRAPLPPEGRIDAAREAVARDYELLIGTTREEARMYLAIIPPLGRLTSLPVIGRLIRRVLVRVTTNSIYTRGARRYATAHRAAGGRALRYELMWAPPERAAGAGHVTDVPLLLGTRESWAATTLVGTDDWDELDRRGRAVRQVWADFARGGVDAVRPEPVAETLRFA